ncbi:MAG: tetratricopeptide repeat protein [Pyrinomonadaceae bacterium]
MTGRILILTLCLCAFSIQAQVRSPEKAGKKSSPSLPDSSDELIKHLTAAENYQISGDLTNAAVENRAVLGIALQRSGNIAIEEGRYSDAIKNLTDSLNYDNSASNRTNLAIAYLRQNQLDKALTEARAAVALDADHIGARYILGNIYYTEENFEAALPELEKAFAAAPDFELARALGLTYLKLKKVERARKHFEMMQSSTGKESADLHLLLAKIYESTNFPADAERELKTALGLEPNKPKINFYLGYLLLQNGGSERLAESGAAFEKELKINPNDFYSLFFSGVTALSQNDNEKAIPFLQKAVEINPNSGEGFLFLGQAQIETNDLPNAEKHLRRAIELESNGAKNTQARRTHFILGRLLLKTGRKDEGHKELVIAGQLQQSALDSSRDEIDRILSQVAENEESKTAESKKNVPNVEIKLAPERLGQLGRVKTFLTEVIAQSYNNLGVIATQIGQLSQAIDNFSAAYSWKPEFPNLSRNLGIVSFQAGEFEKSVAPLARHLQANPQDVLIRKMLGSSYYFTRGFSKSVETLKPIEAKFDDPELAYFYGISLIQLERNLEAVQVFNQLAKDSRQTPEALFYAAQGFMIAGDYQRAVLEFGQILSIAPDTSKANYFIGQSFIRLNRFAEAEKYFSRELEINPGDALSKYHLALTLIERKIETEKAIQTLEEAISLRNDYADAHYQLGKIYLEKGETKKAIEQLESAVSADAEKDYIHYQLSIAYRKASRKDDADRELKLYQKLKGEKRKTNNPMPMGADENSIPGTKNK